MGIRLMLLIIGWFSTVCTAYRRLSKEQVDFKHENEYPVSANTTVTGDFIRRRLADNSHLVKSLPGLDESIVHYAGHVTIDAAKSSNIFYWLFEAPANAESLPLLIWLNGGPGCSSMDGLWLELGPLRLDSNGKGVSVNPFSWHNAANLLFVDQPVGTGFAYTKSKTGYATNDDMINSHFYTFLTEFFALHPRYVSAGKDGKRVTRPFFMSGESHAGHYIPTMALHILQKNAQIKSGSNDLIISLEGIALGNPWLDPYYQYDASEFAHGLGLINLGQKHRLKELERKCQGMLNSGKYNNPACFSLLDKIVDSTTVSGSDRVLMYDTRKFVRQTSSFPPGHEALERYLNRADVKEAIHATDSPNRFEECANPPFYALSHQDGKGVTKELTHVLDAGVRVLVFAGQYDLICNHVGIEKVLRGVPWKHQRDWLLALPGVWAAEGKPIGFSRSFKNLEFLIVLDAGHMVPMDQPLVGLSMINAFLQNQRFGSGASKLGVALSGPDDDIHARCPRYTPEGANTTDNEAYGSGNSAAPKTSSSLMSSLTFWPAAASEKKVRGGTRKGRGRRNFSSTPPLQYTDPAPEQRQRQLLEDSSAPPPYTLSIGHATPMNGSVLLHLRLTQTGISYHQQHQALHDEAAAALLSQHFEVRVDPGQRDVHVDVAALVKNKLTTDILIDKLHDGVEYSFTTLWQDAKGDKQLMSRRSVTVKPGCFHPAMIQCCGNGECVAAKDSGAGAYCKCDGGYTGALCSSYAVSKTGVTDSSKLIMDTTATCPAHPLHHAHLVNASIHSKKKVVLEETKEMKYCTATSSGSERASCCVSVGLVLQPRGALSWAAPAKFDVSYKSVVSSALRQDIVGSLQAHGSAMVRVDSTVGSALQSLPGDTVVVNRTATHPANHPAAAHSHAAHTAVKESILSHAIGPSAGDTHAHSVQVTVRLCGQDSEVNTDVQSLLQQLGDSSSALRSGLVSGHLKANHVFVVAHAASTQPLDNRFATDETDNRDGKPSYLWMGAMALVAVSIVLCSKKLCGSAKRNVAEAVATISRDKDATAKI